MARLELFEAKKLASPFKVHFDSTHRYWYMMDPVSTQTVDIGAHLEERAVTMSIDELKDLVNGDAVPS